MATRTNDLTEFAKPVADEMAARAGSLKRILSAGVLSLADLTPEQREYYMAKAVGKELTGPESSKPESITELIETVKHYVRYKIPSAEERRLLESLRKVLADDSAAQAKGEKQKRRKDRRGPKEAG